MAHRRRLGRVAAHVCAAGEADVDPRTGMFLSDDPEDAAFREYCIQGSERAKALTNRGPLRLGPDGKVHPDIVAEYDRTGFYVLESVVAEDEIAEMRAEFEALLGNAPSAVDSAVDSRGNPVRFPQIYNYGDSLADPNGGGPGGVHRLAHPGDDPAVTEEPIVGRHQMKMRVPTPPPGAPSKVMSHFMGPMAYMDSLVRAYGHPGLLKVAEAVNGPDFVPFTETMWFKAPWAASTAWHQDPSSSWDEEWRQPGFDTHKMGFSFHLCVYRGTAVNSLWMVPGSQFEGRVSTHACCACASRSCLTVCLWLQVDIKALSASGDGSDRLPGAVPILMEPGDCVIQSRTALHGAFPNMSTEPRCTFQFGFNKRGTVEGLTTRGYGHQGTLVTYDAEYLKHRSKMIQWAISARQQRWPEEEPYVYQPLAAEAGELVWSTHLRDDPETMRVLDATMPIVV